MEDDSVVTYTVKDTAGFLHMSAESLRRYTRQFSQHLSTSARPPKGQERLFTRDDVCLLAWARERIRDGATWHDVDRALLLVTPEELPNFEDVTGIRQDRANEPTALDTPNRLLTVLEKMADTSTTAERQQSEIGQLRTEVAELRAEVNALRAAMTDTQRLTFWDRLTGRKPPA